MTSLVIKNSNLVIASGFTLALITLASQQSAAESLDALPDYREDERACVELGNLGLSCAHGFLRVRCTECGHEKLVAFSCKRRSLFAVHPELLAPVLQIIHRVIATHLIKQAGVKRSEAATGAVTLIQRFGSAANLNIHLHGLVLDGVYCTSAEGAPVFHPASALTGEKLQALLGKTPYRDGTSHLVMSPLEFMQRLAALVPRPRLLKRVYGFDVERCECGGKLKIIAALEAPAVIERITACDRFQIRVGPVQRIDLPPLYVKDSYVLGLKSAFLTAKDAL